MSPDPDNAGAFEEDPQSWNGYAYARNNPMVYTDPSGLAYQLCTPEGGCIYDYSDSDFYWYFEMDPSVTLSGGTIWADGQIIGYYSHLNEDSWFKRYRDEVTNASQHFDARAGYQLRAGNYLAYAIDKVGAFLAPSSGTDVALSILPIGRLAKLGKLVIGLKIAKQMGPRGWTQKSIREAIRSGKQIKAVNKANGNPATRYVHPRTGQSVVVDDVTNEVIHVGGPGFKYGPGSGDLP